MERFVRRRAGLPNVARKLRAGTPLSIAAFGTSMTADGYYLRAVLDALGEWPGPKTFAICGFPGWPIVKAVQAVAHVIECRPDLVLIEFAVNDMLLDGDVATAVERSLEHTRTQMLATVPDCEFVEIYFRFGADWVRPEVGIAPHERVADAYGWPSFDLAALTDEHVAAGRATAIGEGGLTRDGTHHTPLAEPLIGVPFAHALAELIRTS